MQTCSFHIPITITDQIAMWCCLNVPLTLKAYVAQPRRDQYHIHTSVYYHSFHYNIHVSENQTKQRYRQKSDDYNVNGVSQAFVPKIEKLTYIICRAKIIQGDFPSINSNSKLK